MRETACCSQRYGLSLVLILPFQVRVGKLEGEQGINAIYNVGAVCAVQQEADGLVITLLHTGYDLTAFLAAMANERTGWSGCWAFAAKSAVRSAHRPEGNATFS